MTITVKHAKTNAITDWTQPQLDAQIAAGNFPPGTTLAQIVIPSDWNNDHTLTGTIDVANGGTGLTTLTANYIPYGNGTSPFQSSANFTFNGTTVTTANDASISGLTVGKGGGAVASNTAVGFQAINASATGVNNVALGYQSLKANTSGNNNTSVGYTSLISNTTGSNNTAVGLSALNVNTTGAQNTAVGYTALQNNTTASNNVAVGYLSLSANTTGTSNSALGVNSLNANILGANNTSIGFGALQNNTTNVATLGTIVGGTGYNGGASGGPFTVQASLSSGTAATTYPTLSITVVSGVITAATLVTNGVGFKDTTTVLTVTSAAMVTAGFAAGGSGFTVPVATLVSGGNNVAIGYSSLNANTSASNNAALGFQALNANTTGNLNCAFGGTALLLNTTGTQNSAFGYQAGRSTTGGFNCYFGTSAGYYVTSGTQNTLLGVNTGATGTNNLTTGSNNTIIGYNAAASAAGVSNEITIGNSSCTSLRLAPLITGYTSAAPTIASAATIAPTKPISFVSGTTTVDTITAPAPISAGGGSITLIPTGIFATSTAGNIALATTAVVGKALILTYDATTTKWYPSY